MREVSLPPSRDKSSGRRFSLRKAALVTCCHEIHKLLTCRCIAVGNRIAQNLTMEVNLMRVISISCALGAALSVAAAGQTPSDPQPIYRVTVVSRSLQAVNYEHRGGPTLIDFNGTVLLPHSKGQAMVE